MQLSCEEYYKFIQNTFWEIGNISFNSVFYNVNKFYSFYLFIKQNKAYAY